MDDSILTEQGVPDVWWEPIPTGVGCYRLHLWDEKLEVKVTEDGRDYPSPSSTILSPYGYETDTWWVGKTPIYKRNVVNGVWEMARNYTTDWSMYHSVLTKLLEERDITFTKNQDMFEQDIKYGPTIYAAPESRKNSIIIREAWVTYRRVTFQQQRVNIPLDWLDHRARWKNSQFEYMAREAETTGYEVS